MEGDTCPICNKKVSTHMYALTCHLCCHPVHRNCTLFTSIEYDEFIKNGSPDLTCRICLESIFPFNYMVDDAAFHSVLVELSNDCCLSDHDYIQPKIFDPSNLNDGKGIFTMY